LLSELGFRLDLSHCAATGVTEDWVWVSPKSGRAVSAEAGEPYAAQRLALPPLLRTTPAPRDAEVTVEALLQGLKLSGYFLERHLFAPHGKTMPQARARLTERLGALK